MKRFAAVIAFAAAGSILIASNPADAASAAKKVKADVSLNELKSSFTRGHHHSGPHPLDMARLFIDLVEIMDDDDYGPPPPPPPPPPRWHRPPPPPPRWHRPPPPPPHHGPGPRWGRPGPGPRPGPRFRPAPPRGPRPGPGPRFRPGPGPRPGGPGPRGIRPPRR